MSRTCVRIFLWAFAALLVFSVPFPTVCSVLDAGHCGQEKTDDVNEIDGLNECSSSPFFLLPPESDVVVDIVTRDYKVILDNVSSA